MPPTTATTTTVDPYAHCGEECKEIRAQLEKDKKQLEAESEAKIAAAAQAYEANLNASVTSLLEAASAAEHAEACAAACQRHVGADANVSTKAGANGEGVPPPTCNIACNQACDGVGATQANCEACLVQHGCQQCMQCLLATVPEGDCSACATEFANNGGCASLQAGEGYNEKVSAGCEECGAQAIAHCQQGFTNSPSASSALLHGSDPVVEAAVGDARAKFNQLMEHEQALVHAVQGAVVRYSYEVAQKKVAEKGFMDREGVNASANRVLGAYHAAAAAWEKAHNATGVAAEEGWRGWAASHFNLSSTWDQLMYSFDAAHHANASQADAEHAAVVREQEVRLAADLSAAAKLEGTEAIQQVQMAIGQSKMALQAATSSDNSLTSLETLVEAAEKDAEVASDATAAIPGDDS